MSNQLVRQISMGFFLVLTMLFTTRYAMAGYLWCENDKGEGDWGRYPINPKSESPLVKNYKDLIFDPYPSAMDNRYVWVPTTFNVLACYGSEEPRSDVYQPSSGAVLVTHYKSFEVHGNGRFLCAQVDRGEFCKTLLEVCNNGTNKYTKVRSKEYTRNSDSYQFEIGFNGGKCD